MQDSVVVLGYARTPMGGFQGALAPLKATELGAAAVKAAVERSGAAPALVERIYMGCVLPAGLGQAPARQAALGAGLPLSAEATTLNKMCGSGMQAVIMGAEAGKIAVGADRLIYLPYLNGERTPHLDPNCRGVFFGLSGIHQRPHRRYRSQR